DAPDDSPRARRSGEPGEALLVGLSRMSRSRGARAAVPHPPRTRGARHRSHFRVPAHARADDGSDCGSPSAGKVLRRARSRCGDGGRVTAAPTLRTTERPDVREIVDPERIMVADGAMGTMLYSRGVFINQCYDELNVRSPELVLDVHRAYVKAGAEL